MNVRKSTARVAPPYLRLVVPREPEIETTPDVLAPHRARPTKTKPKPRLSARKSPAKTADVLAADAVIARASRILAPRNRRDRGGGREVRVGTGGYGVAGVSFTSGHRNLVVAPDEAIVIATWLIDREPWVDPLRWHDRLPVPEKKVRVCCYHHDRFSKKGWKVEAIERRRAQARARARARRGWGA